MSAQNVRVFCRFRPMNAREAEEKSQIKFVNSASIQLPSGTKEPHTFVFDRVFPPNTTQEDAFKHTAEPLVSEIMNGYNCTVFAYGQTGSGKTHTMMGGTEPPMRGVIPRLVWNIFQAIEDADTQIEFIVKLSYVEIYNEKIKDLLDPKTESLKIRESPEGVYIQGVAESYVSSYEQVLHLMEAGQSLRAIAATNMNSQSSRSHSVFILTLSQKCKTSGSVKASKLTLVDLAGSEKVRKTGATGQTMVEAQNINKSLAALGNVINALTSGSSAHIPYRDSKLTRLLSDSLGGNSKTVLIITASPADSEGEETLSTCRFGLRAKSIKNNAKVNEDRSAAEYKRLWEAALATADAHALTIAQLQQTCLLLRECLTANNIPIPESVEKINLEEGKKRQQQQEQDEQDAREDQEEDQSQRAAAAVINVIDPQGSHTVNIVDERSARPAEIQAQAASLSQPQPGETLLEPITPKVLLTDLSPSMRKPPPPPPSTPKVPSTSPNKLPVSVSKPDQVMVNTPAQAETPVQVVQNAQVQAISEENGGVGVEPAPKRLDLEETAQNEITFSEQTPTSKSLNDTEKVKVLEAKLKASEEMCKTLLESSLYWRQQRLSQEKAIQAQAPAQNKIAVVISGGGRSKQKGKVASLNPFSVAAVDARPKSPAARLRSPTSRRSPVA